MRSSDTRTVRRVLTRPDIDQAVRAFTAYDLEGVQCSPGTWERRYEVLLSAFQRERRDPLLDGGLRVVRQLPDVQRLGRVEPVHVEDRKLIEPEFVRPLNAITVSWQLDDDRAFFHSKIERAELRYRMNLGMRLGLVS